jgi:Kdo2-lipid IVA lauroyltransferase/acyltransferase
MALFSPPMSKRSFLHPVEAVAAFILYMFFKFLSLDAASALGGWIGRTIGPRLGISRRAIRNLSKAYPDMDRDGVDRIVRGMWDHLGRVAAEYPHLSEFDIYGPDSRVEVIGVEYADLLRDDGKPGIFFSAHIGNWEIISLGATQRGLPLDRIYRAANNRMVEWLYRRGRAAVEGALIPKGPAGVRPLLSSLKKGNHLGILVDQKMNDGIAVPFFGHDAMTAPALAELALKFDCPIVPARVERLKGARFRFVAEAPLEIRPTGDRQKDVLAIMTEVNRRIEKWIRETPEQWLWLHNRWPD